MATQHFSYGNLRWYDITDPTIRDIAGLRDAFPQLSELNLEDALSNIERPKLDQEDNYLFIVLMFPLFDPKTHLTRSSEVDFFVGKDFVITVHDGVLKPLLRTAQNCSEESELRQNLMGSSAAHFFYVLLDRMVDYMFPILYKVESQTHSIEERIFDSKSEKELIREIALVRRDSIALRRIIHHMLPILSQIDHRISNYVEGELEDYFGDLVDHAQKAKDMIDEEFEVISALSDTADRLLTHRLNSVIRILTVISVIMLPLTLVSGVFGMNIALPIAGHEYAFAIIVLLMLTITITMLIAFRLRHWI